MVGDIKLGRHTVFGSNFWRAPHDPEWTESGVGLASEFGCGEDGHTCGPGWRGALGGSVTNGVLGYAEAKEGEAFLKIGVGALIKGQCPACLLEGSDDSYNFNSPYTFHQPPIWRHHLVNESAIAMEHAAELQTSTGRMGYRLRRTISVAHAKVVAMETDLENTGDHPIRTPFYSHHFLAFDDRPTGPPLELSLDLNLSAYTDCLAWAEPLASYFELGGDPRWLRAHREVRGKTKIKAVYAGASHHRSRGTWEAKHPGWLSLRVEQTGPLPLYGYALYIEERTLSPEPVQMLEIAPGESIRVTRTVTLRRLRQGLSTAPVEESPWKAAAAHAGFRPQHAAPANGRASVGTMRNRAQPK